MRTNDSYQKEIEEKFLGKFNVLEIYRVQLKHEKRPRCKLECNQCGYQWDSEITYLFSKKFRGCQNCIKIKKMDKLINFYYESENCNPNILIPRQPYCAKGVKIICKEHGERAVDPIILGRKTLLCRKCAYNYQLVNNKLCPRLQKTTAQAKEQIYRETNGEFKMLSTYSGTNEIAKFCHIAGCGKFFEKTFHQMLLTRSCPYCRTSSTAERTMHNILLSNHIKYIYQWKYTTDSHRHFFDFYLPDYKVLIELQGSQHGEGARPKGDLWYDPNRARWDNEKRKIAKMLNLQLIEINYLDFYPRQMIKILNENNISCSYFDNYDYAQLTRSKKEVAEYAWDNGRQAAMQKFSLSAKSVSDYVKLVYGKTLNDKRDEEQNKKKDAVAVYYLNHTMVDTCNKYQTSQGSVERFFKEKYGCSKSEFIKAKKIHTQERGKINLCA